jgi:hypothetical protein
MGGCSEKMMCVWIEDMVSPLVAGAGVFGGMVLGCGTGVVGYLIY